CPVVVAPRGELASSALGLKWLKKTVYLALARVGGLYRDLIWQASSELEKADIESRFSPPAQVIVAPNLPAIPPDDQPLGRFDKTPGTLSVVFVSRLVPIKNLAFALRALRGVQGRVDFDIYGPKEDLAYWKECEELIRSLPPNVVARYHGPI